MDTRLKSNMLHKLINHFDRKTKSCYEINPIYNIIIAHGIHFTNYPCYHISSYYSYSVKSHRF